MLGGPEDEKKAVRAKWGSIYILVRWSEAEEEDHHRNHALPSSESSPAASSIAGAGEEGKTHLFYYFVDFWSTFRQFLQPTPANLDQAKTSYMKTLHPSSSGILAPSLLRLDVAGKLPGRPASPPCFLSCRTARPGDLQACPKDSSFSRLLDRIKIHWSPPRHSPEKASKIPAIYPYRWNFW